MASDLYKILVVAAIQFATILQSAPSLASDARSSLAILVKKMGAAASVVEESSWGAGEQSLKQAKLVRTNLEIKERCEKQILAFGPEAIPELLKALDEPDSKQAQYCAALLTRFGPDVVRPALEAFSLHIDRSFDGYSSDLAYGASAIGELGDAATEPLMKGLKDPSNAIRIAAMQVIKQMVANTEQQQGYYGPIVPIKCVAPICAYLESDPDPLVRRAACEALGQIGPRTKKLIQVLYKAAGSDASPSVRKACVKALGHIGTLQSGAQAEETSNHLISVLQHDLDGDTRAAAAEAIGEIHLGPHAVSILAKAMTDSDSAVQWAAVGALPSFRESAISAIPQAVQCMDRLRKTETRQLMLHINKTKRFDRFQPDSIVIVSNNPVLETARDDYQRALYAITRICGIFGENGAPAVPMLIRMLEEDADAGSRCQVMDALGKIGPAASSAEPILLKIGASEPSLSSQCQSTIKKIKAPRYGTQ